MQEIKKKIKKHIGRSLRPIIDRIRFIQYKKDWKERTRYFYSLNENQYEDELKKIYKTKMGHDLNLEKPERYTEKVQWRKLKDRNPIYSELADKYAVRNWVDGKIGSEYLVPLLGVWNSFDEIDFRRLPESFVLKTTNSSKTTIIVRNKANMDYELTRRKMEFWLRTPLSAYSLELHYLNIQPRIIAEQYLLSEEGKSDIEDYKFICFHGEPKYCWVDFNRSDGHKRNVYDLNWVQQSWTVGKNPFYTEDIPKPINFEKMVEIARELSRGFQHVRVDLYNVLGRIYFGEMTFTSGGGVEPFIPEEMDLEIGLMWDINCEQVDEMVVRHFS